MAHGLKSAADRDRRTLDDRIMFLMRNLGFRVYITSHSAGRYEPLEREYPSAYGHWQITGDPGSASECTGFIVSAQPWPVVTRLGFHQASSGVWATIHDCLDQVERHIYNQSLKYGRPEFWPEGWKAE